MATSEQQALLRSLPQVDELLQHALVKPLVKTLPHAAAVESARATIDSVRQGIIAGTTTSVNTDNVAVFARMRMLALTQPNLRRVVNASGVVIHTNLGRSVLAPSAVEAVNEVARGYSTLEYDTDAMARGSRHVHCEQLICALTGAEAAIAVNNNAAAVMMVLSEFAQGHEAIVSRGEQVEIGGSFRIPDIMAQSHATMVEVGATNKTHLLDYEHAISPDTAMMLKVHTSNYRMIGFTESVSVKELHGLAQKERGRRETSGNDLGLLVYEDQGSGAFIRLDSFGEYAEPTVSYSLKQGADIVSFSGDKLLGGPQAGIIVGRKELIDRLKRNPLARAMRLDKMTLAALEATLRLYLEPERALSEIPTLAMLSTPAKDIKPRAEKLASLITKAIPKDSAKVEVVTEISRAGGGALPMCDIPTYCVQISFEKGSALECDRHLISQRRLPIIGRLKKETLLFDARTLVNESEYDEIATALSEYFTIAISLS